MADENAQSEWVKRVLGVVMPDTAAAGLQASADPGAAAANKVIPKLMPIWRDAKEEVDGVIGKLQDALRAEDDEDLDVIVNFGLFGIGKRQTVLLMAALTDADKDASPAALAKVSSVVGDYEAFLAASPAVDLLEDNPFGISVPMRKTLGGALSEIAKYADA